MSRHRRILGAGIAVVLAFSALPSLAQSPGTGGAIAGLRDQQGLPERPQQTTVGSSVPITSGSRFALHTHIDDPANPSFSRLERPARFAPPEGKVVPGEESPRPTSRAIDSYEPDDNGSSATPIFDGVPQHNHSIDPINDEDWVSFTISETSTIVVETSGASGDTELYVLNDQLTIIGYDDDSGQNFFSRITMELPPGNYFAATTGWQFSTFVADYTFSLDIVQASERSVRFERLWPTIQMPWLFGAAFDIEEGPSGDLYITAGGGNRVMRYTTDGYLVSQWGTKGAGPGEFDRPIGVTVTPDGEVFVADADNNRVQKFTSDGEFLFEFGSEGSGNGQFIEPFGVVVDVFGFILVSDRGNHRIQVFDPDGNFYDSFGTFGTGAGQLNTPSGMFVDGLYLYVADMLNFRIQVFDIFGSYVGEFGSRGTGPGQFERPINVEIDEDGFVYVTDLFLHNVQKFTYTGTYLDTWGTVDPNNVPLVNPDGLTMSAENILYVVDGANDRIVKYTPDGDHITDWRSFGFEEGQFAGLNDAVVMSDGSLVVADTGVDRLQRFDANGNLLDVIGEFGSGNGQFDGPTSLTVDGDDNLYVCDALNARVQKFSFDSNSQTFTYVTQFGSLGTGNGQFGFGTSIFDTMAGIAVDEDGFVYVCDGANSRVQRFVPNGAGTVYTYDLQYGTFGTDTGQMGLPRDLDVDDVSDRVFVADFDSHQVEVFTKTGAHVMTWGSGVASDMPGQFNFPTSIKVHDNLVHVGGLFSHRFQAFTPDGDYVDVFGDGGAAPGFFFGPSAVEFGDSGEIYVVDNGNQRMQRFTTNPPARKTKAVVVSAGGNFPGNDLWSATRLNANFAVRTLLQQGFNRDTIYYLSSDTTLDLDGNGVQDDVDATPTNANLQNALTSWATQDGDEEDVIVYLVDHGGPETFRMSENETLDASTLDGWLDTLENNISGTLTVIYDACESGTFRTVLSPSNSRRVVLTSTSPGESAYFLSQGSVSFSNYFWAQIFDGASVGAAFNTAKDGMAQAVGGQTPLKRDPAGLANSTFVGNGTDIASSAPTITSVSPAQDIDGTNTATLWADPVTDPDGITRVWATIRHPDFVQADSTNPILELPSIELFNVSGNRYEATSDTFTRPGLYQISVYARDRVGNTTPPKVTTVSVDSPLKRRAILIGGGKGTDASWPAYENVLERAYDALKLQGYSDDNIAFRAPVTFDAGVDGLATSSNLEYLLTSWAKQDTQDVVLYLVGPSSPGKFNLGSGDKVSFDELDDWLDTMQSGGSGVPGVVTVIYDADHSGGLIPASTPPTDRERITIGSTQELGQARFLTNGDVSFSAYFWTRVLNGASVRSAFKHAQIAMRFSGKGQRASWDDNGNAVADEKEDGQVAILHNIGMGILLAGDDPLIGTVRPAVQLNGTTNRNIWVEDVTTTEAIQEVRATITPPGGGAPDVIELTDNGSGRYEKNYNGFTEQGIYTVSVVAIDVDGNVSLPAETTIEQLAGSGATPDAFENDDTSGAATLINPSIPILHERSFHDNGDQDWYTFSATTSDRITIETRDLGPQADTQLVLYQSNGTTVIDTDDDSNPSDQDARGELYIFQPPSNGTFFLRIRTSPDTAISPTFGPDATYTVRIVEEVGGCVPGQAYIDIGDTLGQTVENASVVLVKGGLALAPFESGDGSYIFADIPEEGTYTLQVSAAGYITDNSQTIDVECGGVSQVTVTLDPSSPLTTPVISVSPASLDYGIVSAGATKNLSFTVTNIGGGTLSGAATDADNPFRVVVGENYSGLSNGQSAQVTIRFKPDGAATSESDQIEFTVNGGDSGFGAVSGASDLDPQAVEDSAAELQDGIADSAWADGLLDFDEANALLGGISLDLFTSLDTNGDGFLSLIELLEITVGPVGVVTNVWVDRANTGTEEGTQADPFDSVQEGVAFVQPSGTVHVVAADYPETMTLGGALTMVAEGATEGNPVRIGAGAVNLESADTPIVPLSHPDDRSTGESWWKKLWRNLSGESKSTDSNLADLASLVYEPAMPSQRTAHGARMLTGDSPIALRLLSDRPIDGRTAWAEVPPAFAQFVSVDWFPSGDGDSDLWVRVSPTVPWESLFAETAAVQISVSAGAAGVAPVTFVFEPADQAAASVASLDGGIGLPLAVAPEVAYPGGAEISLPIPSVLALVDVELWYYHAGSESAAWYPAAAIHNFAGNARIEHSNGESRYVFTANHAGVVQLRRTP